ncbi:ABC transporter substrate-binding protein [Nocardioides alcanivorans]|uniref:ABC transporter substrate-binding protein n=1 Tax=Nocardioides alcanivorans TaxID=2897352 RepID=UPI001F42CE57|nr:ABC transporter substrate-binding protein [Nocardioides alcanivorans]
MSFPEPARRRRLLPASVLTATAMVATGCGTVSHNEAAAEQGGEGYPVTTSGCAGRDVAVASPPRRVVTMHPSITEVLIQLGVGDRVVAQAQSGLGEPSAELADEVAAVPTLSTDSPPDKETLIEQEPDLVLSGTEYEFNTEMGFAGYDDLEALGIPAYTAAAGCAERRSSGTVADTFVDLAFLGQVFDVSERAAKLEDDARGRLEAVAEQITGIRPVRTALVYVEGGKLYAIGGAVEADILRLAGGESVFADDQGLFTDFFAAEVNPEVVLAKDPDAFVFSVTDAEHERKTREYLTTTFAHTAAVREGRLVAVDNTFVQPGTLSSVEGVEIVAEGLHR